MSKRWWWFSFPPANHQWFPGAWILWWPIYRRWIYISNQVKRWWYWTFISELVRWRRDRTYWREFYSRQAQAREGQIKAKMKTVVLTPSEKLERVLNQLDKPPHL